MGLVLSCHTGSVRRLWCQVRHLLVVHITQCGSGTLKNMRQRRKTLSQNARQVRCKIYADTECAAHLRASAGQWDAKAEEKWSYVVRTKKGRKEAGAEWSSVDKDSRGLKSVR